MGRTLILLYGLLCYLAFFGVFVYLIGFLGDVVVPRTIDSGAPTALGEALLIDAALVLLFVVTHTVMARPGFKEWWTRVIPEAMERSTYVLVASLCLALAIWQWRSVPDVVWAVEGDAGRYALYGLYGLGWAIALLSSFLINHFDLFGLQQVYYHWRGRDMPAHSYRTPLLYRVVRHPLMLGLAIVFWAVPTMSVGHLIFSVGMTLYILVGIQFEERDLVRAFGDDYRAYRRRTSMLIPMPPRADNR